MSKEGGSGEAASQDAGGASGDAAKDAIFETTGPKKIVRIVTVLAYMFSVSFVAIVLSAYYLFLWEPPNPRLLHSASRLREGPRVHYLRADPPQMQMHFQENLEDEFLKKDLDQDETNHKLRIYNESYDNFYETLASLRNTLVDVLRKRSNDSTNDRYEGKNVTPFVRVKINGERSQTLTDDSVKVRKDTQQEAKKFIPSDKSGINDNTTRTLPDRREEKDESKDPTSTARQIIEYIVNRHRFLSNPTNNELMTSTNNSKYDDSSDTNGGGREKEKKDAKTTGKSPSGPTSLPHLELGSKDDQLHLNTVFDSSKMQLPRKMSAQNVMASISRTLGNREKAQANEIRFAGEERKDKLYEPKHKKKLVRVLTVVAYIIFVSMAAILLSLYYTFLWDPKDQAIRKMRVHKPVDCATIKTFDSLTIPPISNETQIEKVTARSTTINDTLERLEISTTLREKSLIEILTETTKSKQVSPYVLSSIAPTKVEMVDAVTITKSHQESTSRN